MQAEFSVHFIMFTCLWEEMEGWEHMIKWKSEAKAKTIVYYYVKHANSKKHIYSKSVLSLVVSEIDFCFIIIIVPCFWFFFKLYLAKYASYNSTVQPFQFSKHNISLLWRECLGTKKPFSDILMRDIHENVAISFIRTNFKL